MTQTDISSQTPIDFTVVGEAFALMAQCPLYATRTLMEIPPLVLPPLALGQIRIWRRGRLPVGMATWAFLDAERERAVIDGAPLAPEDWACGERAVVMDFLAPFGDGFAIGRDLSRTIFPGVSLMTTRRNDDGSLRKIVRYPGRDADGVWQSARATAA